MRKQTQRVGRLAFAAVLGFALFVMQTPEALGQTPVIKLLSRDPAQIGVENWKSYDPALFAKNTYLPPCGGAAGSRTLLFIREEGTLKPLQAFCTTDGPDKLQQLNLSMATKKAVFLEMFDRRARQIYTSNCLSLTDGTSHTCEAVIMTGGNVPTVFPAGYHPTNEDAVKEAFKKTYGREPSAQELSEWSASLAQAGSGMTYTEKEKVVGDRLMAKLMSDPTNNGVLKEAQGIVNRAFEKAGKQPNGVEPTFYLQRVLVLGLNFSALANMLVQLKSYENK